MDLVTLSLAKKYANNIASGIKSYSVDGLTLKIVTTSGQTLSMNFPSPRVKDIDITTDGYIIFTLEDGTEIKSEEAIPSAKISAQPGNSISQKEDGLYVPACTVDISEDEGNAIEERENGLYVAISGGGSAEKTIYDNTTSELEATNVQDAIDELAARPSGGSVQLTGTLCCIGDSFTEGTKGGFLDDTFEELSNYSTIRTNQSQYRTYPWWIAKMNPNLTVKNFALGQSVITRGNLSSSDTWYSKCFGVGTDVEGITDNFSYQNIPFADVYFIQFGINDCQCQKNGKQMGIKESFSLTNRLLIERSLVVEQYRTDDYTTDFNNPSYIPATFAEGISAIVNKCRMTNPKARIVWLISELTLDHATYNIIVTLCNFHGIDYIDMCKVWGCMQSNRKDVTLEGVYTSTVTPKDDSFVVATTQKTRSGSLNNVLYAAIDAHPNALAHQLKGEWLSKWLNKNI